MSNFENSIGTTFDFRDQYECYDVVTCYTVVTSYGEFM